jgi:hypothetical protein
MRRVIIIVVVVLLVLAAVLGYLFFRQVGGPVTGSGGGQTGSLPVATTTGGTGSGTTGSSTIGVSGAGILSIIDGGQVAAYFVDANGMNTLVRPDGSIGQIVGGQFVSLASGSISGFMSAVFSYD